MSITSRGQLHLFGGAEQSAPPIAPKKVDWVGDKQSIFGCLGASNHSTSTREQLDFYATDPIAAEWLISLENLHSTIWEPACGQGHLAKVFETAGYTVKATDLIDRGYGTGGQDFLACSTHWKGDIVTNPPYSLAAEFIEHALSLVDNGSKVCMFLKVTFLEGKARKRLFEQTPPIRVWVSSSRIPCGKNGVFEPSAVAYAWYVWEKGYQGDTTLKWFN